MSYSSTSSSRAQRSTRKDFDYREYNRSGRKIEKVHLEVQAESDSSSSEDAFSVEEVIVESSEDYSHEVVDISKLIHQLNISGVDKMSPALEDLKDQLSVLIDDINDFLEENCIESGDVMSISDLDDSTNKVEGLRSEFRKIHTQLKKNLQNEYDVNFLDDYEKMILRLKEYVNAAKRKKSSIRSDEMKVLMNEKYEKERKEEETLKQTALSANFAIDEVSRMIDELYKEFSKSRSKVCNSEIRRRREEFPKHVTQLDRLSDKVQNMFEVIPDTYPDKDAIVTDIKSNYKLLLEEKRRYVEHFQAEFIERDLIKEKLFQRSSLNIKIPKFGGFESSLDIYSFQSEFEKLYIPQTP